MACHGRAPPSHAGLADRCGAAQGNPSRGAQARPLRRVLGIVFRRPATGGSETMGMMRAQASTASTELKSGMVVPYQLECSKMHERSTNSNLLNVTLMTLENAIRTRHAWIEVLASKSPTIAKLDLKAKLPDDVYKDVGVAACNADAFNLANSDPHNAVIARTLEALTKNGTSAETITKFLTDLTSRNTYGTFSELSAYAFLLKGGLAFDIQVPVTAADVLNPNGSDIDGCLHLSEDVLFDVKGFGFYEHLVGQLADRLSAEVAPDVVSIEDSWDVPIDLLSDLSGKNYKPLKNELMTKGTAKRGLLRFTRKARTPLMIQTLTGDPYLLARENADYAFRYAKQFARNRPFALMFVIHPWFSGSLHVNFSDSLNVFTRALARRTFMQFRSDQNTLFGLTKGAVSELLSGIFFIDAYEGTDSHASPRYRCYLNPFAAHKVSDLSTNLLLQAYQHDILIDTLKHDAY